MMMMSLLSFLSINTTTLRQRSSQIRSKYSHLENILVTPVQYHIFYAAHSNNICLLMLRGNMRLQILCWWSGVTNSCHYLCFEGLCLMANMVIDILLADLFKEVLIHFHAAAHHYINLKLHEMTVFSPLLQEDKENKLVNILRELFSLQFCELFQFCQRRQDSIFCTICSDTMNLSS